MLINPKYDDNADDTEESALSALNNLDSEVDEGDDPKELDFDNDTWSLAGGDPDYWYCDNCGKAARGGGSCPECGLIREMTESLKLQKHLWRAIC